MVGGNELAQVVKMVKKNAHWTRWEWEEDRTDGYKTFIKNIPKERAKKSRNRWEEDDKKKEEEGEKSTPQIDPRVDRIEQLFKESFMFTNYFWLSRFLNMVSSFLSKRS